MDVFLSWSGERSSAVAQLLAEWLPQVVQAVDPFVSTTIEKGRRWSGEIAERLASAPVGIVCVTRDNLRSPWLLFEAGAISKPRDGYVCTFLFDVEPADVEPPLGDFQHTRAVKGDVHRLIQTINGALALKGEKTLTEGVLDRVFERNWPELELRLQTLQDSPERRAQRPRSDRDVLDEILALVRQTSAPASWHDAAIAERLVDAGRASRAQTNRAFAYSTRVLESSAESMAQALAGVEKLEGLVTCRVDGDEIESVFLRPAETDLTSTLRSLGLRIEPVRARAIAFEWSPAESPTKPQFELPDTRR
jgi:hypothetical protein